MLNFMKLYESEDQGRMALNTHTFLKFTQLCSLSTFTVRLSEMMENDLSRRLSH